MHLGPMNCSGICHRSEGAQPLCNLLQACAEAMRNMTVDVVRVPWASAPHPNATRVGHPASTDGMLDWPTAPAIPGHAASTKLACLLTHALFLLQQPSAVPHLMRSHLSWRMQARFCLSMHQRYQAASRCNNTPYVSCPSWAASPLALQLNSSGAASPSGQSARGQACTTLDLLPWMWNQTATHSVRMGISPGHEFLFNEISTYIAMWRPQKSPWNAAPDGFSVASVPTFLTLLPAGRLSRQQLASKPYPPAVFGSGAVS